MGLILVLFSMHSLGKDVTILWKYGDENADRLVEIKPIGNSGERTVNSQNASISWIIKESNGDKTIEITLSLDGDKWSFRADASSIVTFEVDGKSTVFLNPED